LSRPEPYRAPSLKALSGGRNRKTATRGEIAYRPERKPIASLMAVKSQGEPRPPTPLKVDPRFPWLSSSNKSALCWEGVRPSAHHLFTPRQPTHRIPHLPLSCQALRSLCELAPCQKPHFMVSLERSCPPTAIGRRSRARCAIRLQKRVAPLFYPLPAVPRSPISPGPTTPARTVGLPPGSFSMQVAVR